MRADFYLFKRGLAWFFGDLCKNIIDLCFVFRGVGFHFFHIVFLEMERSRFRCETSSIQHPCTLFLTLFFSMLLPLTSMYLLWLYCVVSRVFLLLEVWFCLFISNMGVFLAGGSFLVGMVFFSRDLCFFRVCFCVSVFSLGLFDWGLGLGMCFMVCGDCF